MTARARETATLLCQLSVGWRDWILDLHEAAGGLWGAADDPHLALLRDGALVDDAVEKLSPADRDFAMWGGGIAARFFLWPRRAAREGNLRPREQVVLFEVEQALALRRYLPQEEGDADE